MHLMISYICHMLSGLMFNCTINLKASAFRYTWLSHNFVILYFADYLMGTILHPKTVKAQCCATNLPLSKLAHRLLNLCMYF